jgi:hypothetical protein
MQICVFFDINFYFQYKIFVENAKTARKGVFSHPVSRKGDGMFPRLNAGLRAVFNFRRQISVLKEVRNFFDKRSSRMCSHFSTPDFFAYLIVSCKLLITIRKCAPLWKPWRSKNCLLALVAIMQDIGFTEAYRCTTIR